jgi:uncharacterized RDD family membrane protein YckC
MYAGFGKRFGAFLIDFIENILIEFLFFLLWAGFELLLNAIGIGQKSRETILGTLGVPIYLSLSWLYFAFFESSNKKATIGKMALEIEVVDANSKKISFLRATVRYWSKIISAVILGIGFIMAAFTEDKQALHDKIANTYVVNKDAM